MTSCSRSVPAWACSPHLADRAGHVHAVELDRSLAPHLAALAERPNVDLHWGDALQLDLAALDPAPTKLVANLPVQRRHADRGREPRRAAQPRALGGDGAAGGRRPLLRRARRPRRTAASRCSSSSRPSEPASIPSSRTVFRPPPNVDSALVAFRRVPLPDDFARIKRVVEAVVRPPSQDAAELARARRSRLARRGRRGARSDRPPAGDARRGLAPREFVALTEAL